MVKEGREVSARGRLFVKEGREEFYIADSGFGAIGQYDWGASFSRDMPTAAIVQVQFKSARRAFYLNRSMLSLSCGDVVAVAGVSGHDVGVVCMVGWLAQRCYMRQQSLAEKEQRVLEPLPELYRKATLQDVERWIESCEREVDTMLRARVLAEELQLQMKISDVEFQGDGSRALFYYSAEQRVDFRDLVRQLAGEFKVRVEMRQIGPRQEAARIGGIGNCGRRVCCGGWFRQFSSVTSVALKIQDLTPNPQKQTGQCGKLKCCLNFEMDVYEEVKRKMPRVKAPLQFEDGVLYHVKNDLLRDRMYFSTSPKNLEHLLVLSSEQVEHILKLNHSGRKGETLSTYSGLDDEKEVSTQLGYGNVIEEESLTRFDKAKKKKNKNKNRAKQVKEQVDTATAGQNKSQETSNSEGLSETSKEREASSKLQERVPQSSSNNNMGPNNSSQQRNQIVRSQHKGDSQSQGKPHQVSQNAASDTVTMPQHKKGAPPPLPNRPNRPVPQSEGPSASVPQQHKRPHQSKSQGKTHPRRPVAQNGGGEVVEERTEGLIKPAHNNSSNHAESADTQPTE